MRENGLRGDVVSTSSKRTPTPTPNGYTDIAVADTDGDGTFDDEGNVEVGDFGSIDGGDAV